MPLKARSPALTKSQAACLIALRNGKVSKPEIAIQAKLDLIKTARALGTLARLDEFATPHGSRSGRGSHPTTSSNGRCCASQQYRLPFGSYGSWLCKNAATHKRGRTIVPPNHR
jgi:hypothetical protein